MAKEMCDKASIAQRFRPRCTDYNIKSEVRS